MEGDPKGAEPDQDLSWLNQYYVSAKTGDGPEAQTDSTVVVEHVANPPAGMGRLALTSLPSVKYEVVGPIGSGGMKVVRRVRDRDTTRTVAMATIRGELEGEEMAARFVREARITAILEHPNIVPVHDLGTDAAGRPYFTMKMLDGESLQDILKKLDAGAPEYASRYSLGALLEIFKKVCNAMAFAHSKDVVHLDLKPSNIHVSRFGEVLVLDWGLAKYVGEKTEPSSAVHAVVTGGGLSDLTLPGAVKGTLGFMAPEQARGENSRKDKRTDIYALGAILYALLTLKAPPSSDTVERVLADTVAGNIVPPRRRTPGRDIPAALEAVAMKALSVEPEKRYQSVENLSRDVDAFMGGFATSAQDVGIVTLLWLLVKRHKIRVALSALVLLLVAGITAVSMVRIRASERMAVEALNKYRAEQEENRRLGIDAAPQVFKRAQKYMREFKAEDAMRELDVAVTLDSSLASAWTDRGFLQLARQDFAGALESFRRVPGPPRAAPASERRREKDAGSAGSIPKTKVDRRNFEPEAMAEKYVQLTDSGRRSLSGLEFAGFASNLVVLSSRFVSEGKPVAAYHAFSLWNRAHRGDKDADDVLLECLKALNPKAENLTCEMAEGVDGRRATIRGGKGLSNILPLSGMRLEWVDLAGTGVSDLSAMHGMPLSYLDVSGTTVKDLSPLVDVPLKELRAEGCRLLDIAHIPRLVHLERLVLSRDMVDPKQEPLLRKNPGLDVVYR